MRVIQQQLSYPKGYNMDIKLINIRISWTNHTITETAIVENTIIFILWAIFVRFVWRQFIFGRMTFLVLTVFGYYKCMTLKLSPVLIYGCIRQVCSKVWELNHLFDSQTNNEDDIIDIIFGVHVYNTPAHSTLSIR